MEPPIDNDPTLAEVVNENMELKQRVEELENALDNIYQFANNKVDEDSEPFYIRFSRHRKIE